MEIPMGALGHDPCDALTESLAQLKSCLARVNGDVFTELRPPSGLPWRTSSIRMGERPTPSHGPGVRSREVSPVESAEVNLVGRWGVHLDGALLCWSFGLQWSVRR